MTSEDIDSLKKQYIKAQSKAFSEYRNRSSSKFIRGVSYIWFFFLFSILFIGYWLELESVRTSNLIILLFCLFCFLVLLPKLLSKGLPFIFEAIQDENWFRLCIFFTILSSPVVLSLIPTYFKNPTDNLLLAVKLFFFRYHLYVLVLIAIFYSMYQKRTRPKTNFDKIAKQIYQLDLWKSVFIAPITEEIVYRFNFYHLPYNLWKNVIGPGTAFNHYQFNGITISLSIFSIFYILLSGVLFYGAHSMRKGFHHAIFGIFLAYFFTIYENLLLVITLHAIWNSLAYIANEIEDLFS